MVQAEQSWASMSNAPGTSITRGSAKADRLSEQPPDRLLHCLIRSRNLWRSSSLPKLRGKTAIITGATGGIGEATAKLFLAEGANVMLVGRSSEKLKSTREALAADGRVACSVADATDEQATAAAVAATVKTFGGVDILLANAGTEGRVSPIEATSMSDFEQ